LYIIKKREREKGHLQLSKLKTKFSCFVIKQEYAQLLPFIVEIMF